MVNKEITKEVVKKLGEIRRTLGIDAFDDLMDIYFKLHMRIDDLELSRDKWKEKYKELKTSIGNNSPNQLKIKESKAKNGKNK